MLYLGIDQHKSQITVNLRSEDGSVILMRRVSTRWEKIRAFFEDLAEPCPGPGISLPQDWVGVDSPTRGKDANSNGRMRPEERDASTDSRQVTNEDERSERTSIATETSSTRELTPCEQRKR